MSAIDNDPMVSTEWLAANLGSVKLFDGSSHLPTTGRNADEEFLVEHIEGAQRFNIDDIADPDDPLPHTLPSAELFAEKVGALGVGNDDLVVIYDVYGLWSAARPWWMFRAMGFDNVKVLDGGLAKWKAEGRPIVGGPAYAVEPKTFSANFRPELLRSRDQMMANVTSRAEQVVDARAAGRFEGKDPEPRAGMRSGHIPGSRSLPISELIDGESKTLKNASELSKLFDAAGVDPSKPVVSSCGSGVTACVIAIAAYRLGHPNMAVYDGSWTDWGGRQDTPIETGPAA